MTALSPADDDIVRDYDASGDASATFDTDRTYRYALTRSWDATKPTITFLMLNPSTADAFMVDTTIRRCIGFARREGAGTLQVVNLYALRSRHPALLYTHPDPVGPRNDEFIMDAVSASAVVIAGWGAHGALAGRDAAVRRLLAGIRLSCLRVTKDGHPGHPLYVPKGAPLIEYGLDRA
jgi:hypothetical protein